MDAGVRTGGRARSRGLDAEALARGGFPPLLRSPSVASDEDLAGALERHPFTARLLRPDRGRPPRIERSALVGLVGRFLGLAASACPAPSPSSS